MTNLDLFDRTAALDRRVQSLSLHLGIRWNARLGGFELWGRLVGAEEAALLEIGDEADVIGAAILFEAGVLDAEARAAVTARRIAPLAQMVA